MAADMLIATLTIPSRLGAPAYAQGKGTIARITKPEEFWLDGHEARDDFLDTLGIDSDLADAALLSALQSHATTLIDELEAALTSVAQVSVQEFAGLTMFMSGGLSFGDDPTEVATTIWSVQDLPPQVLDAMGVIHNTHRPVSFNRGTRTAHLTDTNVIDAIALGLGSRPEWLGADELEWIAEIISAVREHPGDADPRAYIDRFQQQYGVDPERDRYLSTFIAEIEDDA